MAAKVAAKNATISRLSFLKAQTIPITDNIRAIL